MRFEVTTLGGSQKIKTNQKWSKTKFEKLKQNKTKQSQTTIRGKPKWIEMDGLIEIL